MACVGSISHTAARQSRIRTGFPGIRVCTDATVLDRLDYQADGIVNTMGKHGSLENRDPDEALAEPVTEPIPVVRPLPGGPRHAASAATTLTFKPAPAPWWRTGRVAAVLAAVVALSIVVALIFWLLRGTDPESGTTPAPPPSPSSTTPTTTAPSPSSEPPPPPPPPPAPEENPAPTRQYQPPRQWSSTPRSKPEIGVTRSPISVAPRTRTPPSGAR